MSTAVLDIAETAHELVISICANVLTHMREPTGAKVPSSRASTSSAMPVPSRPAPRIPSAASTSSRLSSSAGHTYELANVPTLDAAWSAVAPSTVAEDLNRSLRELDADVEKLRPSSQAVKPAGSSAIEALDASSVQPQGSSASCTSTADSDEQSESTAWLGSSSQQPTAAAAADAAPADAPAAELEHALAGQPNAESAHTPTSPVRTASSGASDAHSSVVPGSPVEAAESTLAAPVVSAEAIPVQHDATAEAAQSAAARALQALIGTAAGDVPASVVKRADAQQPPAAGAAGQATTMRVKAKMVNGVPHVVLPGDPGAEPVLVPLEKYLLAAARPMLLDSSRAPPDAAQDDAGSEPGRGEEQAPPPPNATATQTALDTLLALEAQSLAVPAANAGPTPHGDRSAKSVASALHASPKRAATARSSAAPSSPEFGAARATTCDMGTQTDARASQLQVRGPWCTESPSGSPSRLPVPREGFGAGQLQPEPRPGRASRKAPVSGTKIPQRHSKFRASRSLLSSATASPASLPPRAGSRTAGTATAAAAHSQPMARGLPSQAQPVKTPAVPRRRPKPASSDDHMRQLMRQRVASCMHSQPSSSAGNSRTTSPAERKSSSPPPQLLASAALAALRKGLHGAGSSTARSTSPPPPASPESKLSPQALAVLHAPFGSFARGKQRASPASHPRTPKSGNQYEHVDDDQLVKLARAIANTTSVTTGQAAQRQQRPKQPPQPHEAGPFTTPPQPARNVSFSPTPPRAVVPPAALMNAMDDAIARVTRAGPSPPASVPTSAARPVHAPFVMDQAPPGNTQAAPGSHASSSGPAAQPVARVAPPVRLSMQAADRELDIPGMAGPSELPDSPALQHDHHHHRQITQASAAYKMSSLMPAGGFSSAVPAPVRATPTADAYRARPPPAPDGRTTSSMLYELQAQPNTVPGL